MNVSGIKKVRSENKLTYKTSVKSGFIQRFKGEMPDIDEDFQSDKRQNVKEYIEQRYNAGNGQQVFSAGTFTTLKAKAALSDVARTHSIPSQVVKYVTKAISDDKASFTDLFKIASRSRKLRDFIMKNPMVIEDLRAVLGNQKSTSVHASAIIPTPAFRDGEKAECFDYLPIRKMDSLLVSEFDGYDCDAVGLLKIDALNTKELTKLSRMFKIVKDVYGEDLSLERIEQDLLEDPKVYECFQKGYTQDIFQFGSDGITKLTVDIRPENIFDLSAINALYRPATIEIGSTEAFGRYKRGEVEPEYMWGTYEATKSTYSLLVYQEQLALIANQVGGLSLADGVKLVKFISKKKVDKIIEYKEKFISGAIKNGCPEDEAKNIWSNFEAAGSYLFNSAHSTAYALLSYVGMYIKCHYPTAFYTVALEFCSDDDIPILMGEMDSSSKCKIVPPDINKSMDTFTTDYTTNQIFWSLSRIKFVGSAATSMICSERKINGNFKSFADFIDRMDKYVEVVKQQKKENGDSFTNPLNFRCIKNMIISGCFDKVEGLTDTPQRYNLIKQLHETYNRTISETEFPPSEISKAHFWSRIQVALSSIGSTDYKRVLDLYGFALKAKNVSYHTFEELLDIYEPIKRSIVVGTIEEIEEKAYKDKTTGENKLFAKITLSENHEQLELIIWDNCWSEVRDAWNGKQGSIVMFVGHVNYSEFNGCNVVQLNKGNSFDFAI